MKVTLLVPEVHFYAPLALRPLLVSHPEHDFRAYLTPKLPENDRFLGGVRRILREKGIRYVRDQATLRLLYGALSRYERCRGRDLEERAWLEVPELLEDLDVPVRRLERSDWGSVLREFERRTPDVLLSVFLNQIVPTEVHQRPTHGSYNLHPGRLPQFRGTAPVFRQLQQDVSEAGCALHELTDELDAGDLYDQRTTAVSERDTVYFLYHRLARLGGRLLSDLIEDLEVGPPDLSPQDEALAETYGDFDQGTYGEFLRDRAWWGVRDFLSFPHDHEGSSSTGPLPRKGGPQDGS